MSVFTSKWKGKNPNLTIMYRVKHSLKELLVHRGSIIQGRSSIITSLSLEGPKENASPYITIITSSSLEGPKENASPYIKNEVFLIIFKKKINIDNQR